MNSVGWSVLLLGVNIVSSATWVHAFWCVIRFVFWILLLIWHFSLLASSLKNNLLDVLLHVFLWCVNENCYFLDMFVHLMGQNLSFLNSTNIQYTCTMYIFQELFLKIPVLYPGLLLGSVQVPLLSPSG